MNEKIYELNTLQDVAEQLGEEQLDRWFADFKLWVAMRKKTEILAQLGIGFAKPTMKWIDDGKVEVSQIVLVKKS